MKKNIKIAKELVKLAKMMVAEYDWTDYANDFCESIWSTRRSNRRISTENEFFRKWQEYKDDNDVDTEDEDTRDAMKDICEDNFVDWIFS